MRALIASSLVVTGCAQIFGLEAPGPARDAAGGDAGDASLCFGTFGGTPVCFASEPSGVLTLPAAIATDGGCGTNVIGGAEACVLDAQTIELAATTRVRGARPLVLVAADAIVITSGYLDAASHAADGAGPAAVATCAFAGKQSNQDGGAGGSFQALGGAGGVGGGGADSGQPVAVPVPTQLRGGCAGQAGGADATPTGLGGAGGGAVWLIAGASIHITAGTINASGAGGGGGQDTGDGGGGGGAGGMIVLDAPDLMIDAASTIFADGGGGGAGEDAGTAGASGGESDGTAPAAGGANTPGRGGAGSHAGALAGADGLVAAAAAGAGGGGGGAGWIFIRGGGEPPASAFSPAPTPF